LGKRTVEIYRSVDFLELDVVNNGSNIALFEIRTMGQKIERIFERNPASIVPDKAGRKCLCSEGFSTRLLPLNSAVW
jgi:hypothetical protein